MIITTYPNKNLRQTCDAATVFDDALKMMIDEMTTLMYSSDGVGLAAPQIGSTGAYFIMDTGKFRACVNPKVLWTSKELSDSHEGCLSLPGIDGTVKRHKKIEVEYQSVTGELFREHLEGFDAMVFQHEYDHLSGKLFVDHMTPFKRKLLLKDYAKTRG